MTKEMDLGGQIVLLTIHIATEWSRTIKTLKFKLNGAAVLARIPKIIAVRAVNITTVTTKETIMIAGLVRSLSLLYPS